MTLNFAKSIRLDDNKKGAGLLIILAMATMVSSGVNGALPQYSQIAFSLFFISAMVFAFRHGFTHANKAFPQAMSHYRLVFFTLTGLEMVMLGAAGASGGAIAYLILMTQLYALAIFMFGYLCGRPTGSLKKPTLFTILLLVVYLFVAVLMLVYGDDVGYTIGLSIRGVLTGNL